MPLNRELATELATIEAEIARLEAVRDWLRQHVNGATPKPSRRRNGRVTASEAAIEALQAAGGPMRTRDLLVEVQARGAKMKDTDGLYKTLDRDKTRFKKAGRGLWTLA